MRSQSIKRNRYSENQKTIALPQSTQDFLCRLLLKRRTMAGHGHNALVYNNSHVVVSRHVTDVVLVSQIYRRVHSTTARCHKSTSQSVRASSWLEGRLSLAPSEVCRNEMRLVYREWLRTDIADERSCGWLHAGRYRRAPSHKPGPVTIAVWVGGQSLYNSRWTSAVSSLNQSGQSMY